MRDIKTLLLAAAAIGLTALPGLANAAPGDRHVMEVRLPNGLTEQIQYTGDVPPHVVLAPAGVAFAEPADPFAMFQRLSAEMDRQAAAMFQAADHMMMQPFPGFGGMTEAGLGTAPAGSGFCARSVQITFPGDGQKPRIIAHTSGNCGASASAPAPAVFPGMPEAAPGLKTMEVRDTAPGSSAKPYQGLVRQLDWHP